MNSAERGMSWGSSPRVTAVRTWAKVHVIVCVGDRKCERGKLDIKMFSPLFHLSSIEVSLSPKWSFVTLKGEGREITSQSKSSQKELLSALSYLPSPTVNTTATHNPHSPKQQWSLSHLALLPLWSLLSLSSPPRPTVLMVREAEKGTNASSYVVPTIIISFFISLCIIRRSHLVSLVFLSIDIPPLHAFQYQAHSHQVQQFVRR